MFRKFAASTRPRVETSIKREKTAALAFDSRRKSQQAKTGNSNNTSKTNLQEALAKKNVSPRKVMSFTMLDEAETINTSKDSQLRLTHEYRSKGKTAGGKMIDG